MSARAKSAIVTLGLVIVAGGLPTACKKRAEPDKTTAAPASAQPQSNELPPLNIRPDTENLLLTWVDDKGELFVVQKPSDVPVEGRKAVRVVVVGNEEGTGKLVYVLDLTETTPDGSYRSKTMTRAAWDDFIASRRKVRLEAMAPSSAPAPSASAPQPAAVKGNPLGKVVVIIYGASWCRPCHDAAAYLKARGVNVIQKDIDESDSARSEMDAKLQRAGLSGAQIPVIDVMGQILIGYSPRSLDRAIEAAQASKPL